MKQEMWHLEFLTKENGSVSIIKVSDESISEGPDLIQIEEVFRILGLPHNTADWAIQDSSQTSKFWHSQKRDISPSSERMKDERYKQNES